MFQKSTGSNENKLTSSWNTKNKEITLLDHREALISEKGLTNKTQLCPQPGRYRGFWPHFLFMAMWIDHLYFKNFFKDSLHVERGLDEMNLLVSLALRSCVFMTVNSLKQLLFFK